MKPMRYRVRSNVLRMQPYSPGKPIDEVKRELGLTEVIKLASNENPLGPSPKAVEAVRQAAEQMNIYPDAAAFTVKQKLATTFGLPAEKILLGNGSDELIHLLGLVFLGDSGDEMMVGVPSFVRYDAAAQIADAKLVRVPLDAQWRNDLTAMAKAATDRTKLIFLANPNNPTGTIVRKPDFDAFLRDLPDGVVVVLDEAYLDYAVEAKDTPNSLDYVKEGKPVIGLRTFSKAYGLAGIRVGFGFADAAVVDGVDRAREPFDVNSLAQVAAMAALDDAEHMERTLALNAAGLKRVAEAMDRLGLSVLESHANFICVDVKRPAEPVFNELLKRGVIVRSGVPLGMPTFLRVTIGNEVEVDKFLAAAEEVLK